MDMFRVPTTAALSLLLSTGNCANTGSQIAGSRVVPITLTLKPFTFPGPMDEPTNDDALEIVTVDTLHIPLAKTTVEFSIESPRPNVQITLELVRSAGSGEAAWKALARANHAGRSSITLNLAKLKLSSEVYYLTARAEDAGFAHAYVRFY